MAAHLQLEQHESAASLALVGLGANLGDARNTLLAAVLQLSQLPGVSGIRRSHLYQTAPLEAGGNDFINAVVELRTSLTAEDLLEHLLALELVFGRERSFRNAPRTLDLDLLLYGHDDLWLEMQTNKLTLPHPRLHQRAFALVPLLELRPDLHLGTRGPAVSYLNQVADQKIRRLPEA